jgi:TolB protein
MNYLKLLIVVSSLMFLLTACGSDPKPEPAVESSKQTMTQPTAAPLPTATVATPTATPTATPIPWGEFTLDSNSFSVSVPSNWKVETDTDSLSLMEVVTGVTTLFSAVDESSGSNVLVLADYRERLEREPQQVDLNKYVEMQSIGLQESLGTSTTVTKKTVVVDGMDSMQLRMDRTDTRLMMNIIIGTEPRAMCGSMPIIVQVTSNNDNMPLMEKILGSFKILPNADKGVDCDDRNSLSLLKTDFLAKAVMPRIAFPGYSQNLNEFVNVYVVNADGSDLTSFTPKAATHVYRCVQGVNWSPNGMQLSFSARRMSPETSCFGLPDDIFVVDADGSTQTISAGAIIDEFIEDSAGANKKFDLQMLSISGLVDMVDHDLSSGALHVTILDSDTVDSWATKTMIGVKCMISNPKNVEALGVSAAYLRGVTDAFDENNMFVTVNGVFSEFNGVDIVLDDCSVTKDEHNLTAEHNTSGISEHSWSPLGNRIAFNRRIDTHSVWSSNHSYAVNPDGSNEIQFLLPEDSFSTGEIAWGPNGESIAFVLNLIEEHALGEDSATVYIINADGSNQRLFATNPLRYIHGLLWSPDGTRLIINRYDALSIIDLDGANTIHMNGNLWDEVTYPSWSPDGNHITFEAYLAGTQYDADNQPAGKPEVYVIDSDGSNLKRLTEDPRYDGQPIWSPDGNRILFTAHRGNFWPFGSNGYGLPRMDLYLIDPDGSNETRLTHNSGASHAAWSPTSDQIAFLGNEESSNDSYDDLYVINADGTNRIRLTDYESPNPFSFAWAPDS